MSEPIRVVVVDDSAVSRRFIASMLEQDPDIRVVGVAADGREAIARVRELRPDVVTMDVRMPVMDGLDTTEHLMAYHPTPILVITASLSSSEMDIGFRMLGAGALEVVEKPSAADPRVFALASRDLIRRVKILSRVKVVTHLRGRRRAGEEEARSSASNRTGVVHPPTVPGAPTKPSASHGPGTAPRTAAPASTPPAPAPRLPAAASFPLVVLGASTGGPRVVLQILAGLPRDFPAAVLVVQHIAEGFSSGMVEWLAGAGPLPVHMAAEGRPLCPGEVLVAPEKCDLLITPDRRAHLSSSPLLIQRPSVDIAMQAAAEVFGARAIGVLLTGMGRDGARGMLSIRRQGGHTIAQDEASCAIYGMPRAAIQIGAAAEVATPAQIAPRLTQLAALALEARAR